ncbi:MAG: hypothetical protein ACRCYU_10715 [Nocardioides sp.]
MRLNQPTIRTRHRMMNPSTLLIAATLALAVTLTGCTNSEDDPPETNDTPTATPTSPAPTSASPTPKTPEERATDQLTRYLDLRDDAYRTAKLNLKQLAKVATGKQYLLVQQYVAATKSSGTKETGDYVHTLGAPNQRNETTIRITDCEDRSGVERRRKGKDIPPPKDPEGNPLRNPLPIDYELVKQKGRWLVSNSNTRWDEKC